jgi:hypothetical protein
VEVGINKGSQCHREFSLVASKNWRLFAGEVSRVAPKSVRQCTREVSSVADKIGDSKQVKCRWWHIKEGVSVLLKIQGWQPEMA